jgi:hypothetical protein
MSGSENRRNEFGTIRLEEAPPAALTNGSSLTRGRRPEWLRVRSPDSAKYRELAGLFRSTPSAKRPCARISANAGGEAQPPFC